MEFFTYDDVWLAAAAVGSLLLIAVTVGVLGLKCALSAPIMPVTDRPDRAKGPDTFGFGLHSREAFERHRESMCRRQEEQRQRQSVAPPPALPAADMSVAQPRSQAMVAASAPVAQPDLLSGEPLGPNTVSVQVTLPFGVVVLPVNCATVETMNLYGRQYHFRGLLALVMELTSRQKELLLSMEDQTQRRLLPADWLIALYGRQASLALRSLKAGPAARPALQRSARDVQQLSPVAVQQLPQPTAAAAEPDEEEEDYGPVPETLGDGTTPPYDYMILRHTAEGEEI
ncbi:hypothetical protein ACFL26_00600 [Patescibacteria group bacterium]